MLVTGQDIRHCVYHGNISCFNHAIAGITLDSQTAKAVACAALIEKGDSSLIMADLLLSSFAITFAPGEISYILDDFCKPGLPIDDVEVF